jgi:hypothetical protein
VLASPTGTEVRGDDTTGSRHTETTQVDGGLIGKGRTAIVGQLVVPLFIEVTCRILENFLLNQSVENYGVNSFHFPVYGSLTRQQILTL